MKKASVTIFATMTMTLVAAMLFSLLEAARFYELKRISQLQTELALESTFADYNFNLWTEYHLLGRDDTGMTEQLEDMANARNMASDYGLNLFQVKAAEVNFRSCTRITDGRGKVFVQAVASYMKEQVLYETIQNLYNQYEAIASLIKEKDVNRSKIDEALESIEAVQQQLREAQSNIDKTSQTNAPMKETESSKTENPLEVIRDLQQRGILEIVMAEGSALSEKAITESNIVSKRTLHDGIDSKIPENQWVDRVLFQQYLLSYFSNYLNTKENTCLSYELEYIIGGKSKDIENLKQVVQQILGIREIINFLYLISDVQAQEEAGGLAVALVGATVNPIVIETVKIGILTAWAFGESILDVRALLRGKKVPLLKSKDSWTLALTDFVRLGQSDFMAKESASGLTYQNYLGILLLFQSENNLAMRTMDLQELHIRKVCGESDFRMDDLCVQTSVSIEYGYHPVFVYFPNTIIEHHNISTEAEFSYY